jgi:hypothetical protein
MNTKPNIAEVLREKDEDGSTTTILRFSVKSGGVELNSLRMVIREGKTEPLAMIILFSPAFSEKKDTLLLKTAILRAEELKCKEVTLMDRSGSDVVRKIYEDFGFVPSEKFLFRFVIKK